MGVKQRGPQGSGKTYFSIYSNQLVIQYDNREELEKKADSLGFDVDDILEREKAKGKNAGDPVYYIVADLVDGMITDIRIKENDFGSFLEIELDDVGDKFIISLGDVFESRFAKDFIRRMENIDLKSPIEFGVWSMSAEETGSSSRAGVKMYQNDQKIEYAISYDDMPAPEEKKKGRAITWDYSEQTQWLFEQLEAFVKDNFAQEVEEKAPEKADTSAKDKGRRKPASKNGGRKSKAAADQVEDDVAPPKDKGDLPWS